MPHSKPRPFARHVLPRAGQTALLLLLLLTLTGCLSERSFPMRPERLVRVVNSDHRSTRDWAARLHLTAFPLLPICHNDALTTDQLSTGEEPTDVWKRFDLNPAKLDNLFLNLRAIEQTSQTVSPTARVLKDRIDRPGWDGFEDVDVPAASGAVLYGRLGTPEKNVEIPGSFVIITHGLFGSLDGSDIINQVQALRAFGHHVLAIEMRGHGQTKLSHPEYALTFGLDESNDLLTTARWLKSAKGATRVGLVSFSLTGFEGLLTAWLDGTRPADELKNLPLASVLLPHQAEPAFNGGMFIASAPVNIIDTANSFEPKFNLLQAPLKTTFQDHVAQRLLDYGQPPGYTMWDMARGEFSRSDFRKFYPSFDAAKPDLVQFLDLSRDHWKVGVARVENIRIPILVLNGANDPLGTAQGVADLFARQHNPNIGVILLKEGGHIGFSAYCADYYYSLMANFFDPATAPATAPATVARN